MHIYNYTVQETDLDFLGHVNNATYVKLYEQARWQLVHEKGYTFKKLNKLQQSPIILAINVKYLKELPARTEIQIETTLNEYKGKVGTLNQVMKDRSTGGVYSEALITFGLFDMRERKLIAPTEEWLGVLQ